jgi:hypothetical protein
VIECLLRTWQSHFSNTPLVKNPKLPRGVARLCLNELAAEAADKFGQRMLETLSPGFGGSAFQ